MRRGLVVVLVLVLAGLGLRLALQPGERDNHASPRLGATALLPSGVKPQLTGILDEFGLPPATYRRVVDGFVVQARWKDLQPSAGGDLAADNVIDRALAQVRALPAGADGARLGIKIRVYAGIWSPEWVMALGGSPATITETTGARPKTGRVPRFWTDQVKSAYQDLQNKLAARYDSVPEIREVTVSRCMTIFAEPMVRQGHVASSVRALLAAGYTESADERCQHEQIDAARVWRHTLVSLAVNPYERIAMDGTRRIDTGFTEDLMRYCRHVLGLQCVLQNNELGRTAGQAPAAKALAQVYDAMRSLGPPIAFQSAAPAQTRDPTPKGLLAVLQTGLMNGGASVELPPAYRQLEPADLMPYDEQLRARALRTG